MVLHPCSCLLLAVKRRLMPSARLLALESAGAAPQVFRDHRDSNQARNVSTGLARWHEKGSRKSWYACRGYTRFWRQPRRSTAHILIVSPDDGGRGPRPFAPPTLPSLARACQRFAASVGSFFARVASSPLFICAFLPGRLNIVDGLKGTSETLQKHHARFGAVKEHASVPDYALHGPLSTPLPNSSPQSLPGKRSRRHASACLADHSWSCSRRWIDQRPL